MFDNRWENWAGDFSESFAAGLLEAPVRGFVPEILTHFGEAARAIDPDFPDSVSPGTFARVMTESMPRLSLPDAARQHIPEVIARFFETLQEGGRLGEGGDWAAQIRILGKSYRERVRTRRRRARRDHSQGRRRLAIGRNDPCPCGSGKKYKKCCMT